MALLRRRVESRLHHAPRFRRRVQQAPLGEPVLRDDPGFEISNHVAEAPRRVMQPRELRATTDAFLSRQLDRERPLWEIMVVPRLGQGRAAILGKVHHALVDGVAAVELGTLLFDLHPTRSGDEPLPWTPEREPSPARFALDLVADSAVDQFRTARRMVRMGMSPRRTLRAAETMRRAALSLAEEVVQPAEPSFLNRPIGPDRSLLHRSVPIRRLERFKAPFGLKLNDVVLAVMTGALRRYARARRGGAAAAAHDGPRERPRSERHVGGGKPDRLRVRRPADRRGRPDAAREADPLADRAAEGPRRDHRPRRADALRRRASGAAEDPGRALCGERAHLQPHRSPTSWARACPSMPRAPGSRRSTR